MTTRTAPLVPPSPPEPPKAPRSKKRVVLLSILAAVVVAAVVVGGVFFAASKSLAKTLDENTELLEANLGKAVEVKAELEVTLKDAGVETTVALSDGAQSTDAQSADAQTEITEDETVLAVDPSATRAALEEFEALSAQISSAETLLQRAADPTESKRALAAELQDENETLPDVTASAATAATSLDEAVEEAVLEAAKAEYGTARAELTTQVESARTMLADSEGKVQDEAVREALSTSITAAEELLATDPLESADSQSGSQSGARDGRKDASLYDDFRAEISALTVDLQTQTTAVTDSVAAKAEADRIAAEQAAAEQAAAEQAAAEQAAAGEADGEGPIRLPSGGCRWPHPDLLETGIWTPVWKVQGWCTEEEFWDAVGCARGYYEGCDKR